MAVKQSSITIRSVVLAAVFLLLANIALGVTLVNQSHAAMKSIVDERMLDLSNTAASLVDGDALSRITVEDKDTPEYLSMLDTLTKFENNIELEYIYTLRKADDGSFYFVIDPSSTNPSEYGEIAVVTEGLLSANEGVAAVDQEPYTDKYGTFYSAYSPVFNSRGEVAGIVAADFDAEWYNSRLNESAQTIIVATLISLTVGCLIVFLLARGTRKRFDTLTNELGDLADAVDDLTREIVQDTGASTAPDDTGGVAASAEAPVDSEERSADIIHDLERRVKTMRANLVSYLDTMHSQANSMITALSSDYRSVYYINLDEDMGVCYQASTESGRGTSVDVGESFPYLETFRKYAEECITDETREGFLNFIEPNSIRRGLEENRVISHLYLVRHDGRESYEMLRMAGVRHAEDRDDHIVHAVGAGFTDADVETRNAMAKNAALRDALAAAEEASKAKTAFLSSMSHEIRTPMNAIIGLDRIALNEPDISEQTRDYLEKIGESANHLLSLINDILDMSRIESGRMSIHNEDFHLADVLSQVNTIIEGQCREKDLHYRFEVEADTDGIYRGDETKLRQVLINILGNAVKFTPIGGEVGLTVEKTAHYDDKSTIRFVARDTGVGIGEEFLPKIFDAFSQEDSHMTSKYGSSGLGMPITKSIVEMMNGTIRVESKKDVGTTFFVTITFADSNQVEIGHAGISPHDLRVLIIDGDTISSEHAALELRNAGIETDVASTATEAMETVKLQHARSHPYNIVLTEWGMPGQAGGEFTRLLREMAGDEAAIVIFSSRQWDAFADEAIAAGADEFMMKPLNVSTASIQLRKVLAKKLERERLEHPKAQLEGRHILVAEDIELNAEILMDILEMREITAEHAENGKIALDLFANNPEGYFDAILMDMRMPVMDGLQATSAIRALDRPDARTIPIIAFTANAFDEDVQNSLQAGLDAHLSKPVDPDILFETLEKLIQP